MYFFEKFWSNQEINTIAFEDDSLEPATVIIMRWAKFEIKTNRLGRGRLHTKICRSD